MYQKLKKQRIIDTLSHISGVRVLIMMTNFRAARLLMAEVGSYFEILRHVEHFQKYADKWTIKFFNGSILEALPFNPEGLRGQRADVVIIDDGPEIDEKVAREVIEPLLTAKKDGPLLPKGVYLLDNDE